jgi:hypothetical protein
MRYSFLGIGAIVLVAAVGSAQETVGIKPEIRPFVGGYMPTGELRDDFKVATIVGAQGALEINRNLHVLGSVGWIHGHNKFAGFSKDLTYIWQYDGGIELNLVREIGNGWMFRPLVGLGGGGRTYDYQAAEAGRKTMLAGYGALGMEFQKGIVALRVEGRDYVTRFESPLTVDKKMRNDATLSFGLAYHLR